MLYDSALELYDLSGNLIKGFDLYDRYDYVSVILFGDEKQYYSVMVSRYDEGAAKSYNQTFIYDKAADRRIDLAGDSGAQVLRVIDGIFYAGFPESGGAYCFDLDGNAMFGGERGEVFEGKYMWTNKGIYHGYKDTAGNWLFREKNYGWFLE